MLEGRKEGRKEGRNGERFSLSRSLSFALGPFGMYMFCANLHELSIAEFGWRALNFLTAAAGAVLPKVCVRGCIRSLLALVEEEVLLGVYALAWWR